MEARGLVAWGDACLYLPMPHAPVERSGSFVWGLQLFWTHPQGLEHWEDRPTTSSSEDPLGGGLFRPDRKHGFSVP